MSDQFKVWKYEWPATDRGPVQEAVFEMPLAAHVLTVQMQRGRIVMWAAVYPDLKREKRKFNLVGTGHEAPLLANIGGYVGTVQMFDGDLVLHIFEEHPYG